MRQVDGTVIPQAGGMRKMDGTQWDSGIRSEDTGITLLPRDTWITVNIEMGAG